jgi:hypothetical protein
MPLMDLSSSISSLEISTQIMALGSMNQTWLAHRESLLPRELQLRQAIAVTALIIKPRQVNTTILWALLKGYSPTGNLEQRLMAFG